MGCKVARVFPRTDGNTDPIRYAAAPPSLAPGNVLRNHMGWRTLVLSTRLFKTPHFLHHPALLLCQETDRSQPCPAAPRAESCGCLLLHLPAPPRLRGWGAQLCLPHTLTHPAPDPRTGGPAPSPSLRMSSPPSSPTAQETRQLMSVLLGADGRTTVTCLLSEAEAAA